MTPGRSCPCWEENDPWRDFCSSNRTTRSRPTTAATSAVSAASLARAANQVTLLLTHAGVLAARAGEHTFWFAALAREGVEVLADGRSLRERGIAGARLSPGVKPTGVDTAVAAWPRTRRPLGDYRRARESLYRGGAAFRARSQQTVIYYDGRGTRVRAAPGAGHLTAGR